MNRINNKKKKTQKTTFQSRKNSRQYLFYKMPCTFVPNKSRWCQSLHPFRNVFKRVLNENQMIKLQIPNRGDKKNVDRIKLKKGKKIKKIEEERGVRKLVGTNH